ncbi:MAG: cytochrome C oxidase subunit IV family protein, partial [Chloroflexota bacterium]|nr:cytochrome C oxidase subunit IV family protein [Chloroflexota bacterium]
HPGARTYVLVGVVLAVITLIEVWAYTQEALRPILVPVLLCLSAAKFILVVGFYMHLRFDHPLFTGVFGFGLAVAASVITALIFLFHQYPYPLHVPGH